MEFTAQSEKFEDKFFQRFDTFVGINCIPDAGDNRVEFIFGMSPTVKLPYYKHNIEDIKKIQELGAGVKGTEWSIGEFKVVFK